MTIFSSGAQHEFLYWVNSCLLCPIIMLIQSYIMCGDKYTKSLNYVLNQNVNVTQRARFVTLTRSNIDKLCLLQQNKLNNIKIQLPRKNSWAFLTFSPVTEKTERSYFGSWGQALVAAAIVERWQLRRALNKSKCMDCLLGQNKGAILEGWPLWRGDC